MIERFLTWWGEWQRERRKARDWAKIFKAGGLIR